jgi:hypothetical protein
MPAETSVPPTATVTPFVMPTDRPAEDQQNAINAIKNFTGETDLALAYIDVSRSSENSLMVVENYETKDRTFQVSLPDERVVYMQSKEVPPPPAGSKKLTSEEGLQKVQEYVLTHNPCFASIMPLLQFTSGDKGDNWFYRWASPVQDPERPFDQPTFVQVAMRSDGLIFGYIDSGICDLDPNALAQATPGITPTVKALPTVVPGECASDSPKMKNWLLYTDPNYGFSFCYPREWMLTLVPNPEAEGIYSIQLLPPTRKIASMAITFKGINEPYVIGRTGVGSGDIVPDGTVDFLGAPVERDVLVFEGKDRAVLYDGGQYIERGEMVYTLALDYTGDWNARMSLNPSLQGTADLIVKSFVQP